MCLAYLLWLTPMHGSASSIITLLHVTAQNNGGTAPAYTHKDVYLYCWYTPCLWHVELLQ